MKARIPFLWFLIFYLALFLIFFFTVGQDIEFQRVVDWNLLMIGSIGVFAIVLAKEKSIERVFDVYSGKEVLQQMTTGVLWGGLSIIIILLLGAGVNLMYNLLGTVNLDVVRFITSPFSVLGIALIQPITETLMVIVAVLFTSKAMQGMRIPFHPIIAVLLVSLLFSGMHFAIAMHEAGLSGFDFPFEFSLSGFAEFIFNVSAIGTAEYVGGFPQLIMGIVWGLIALLYESFIIPIMAHLVYNSVVLYASMRVVGSALDTLNLMILVLFLIIVFSVFKFKFEHFTRFRVRNIIKGV